MVDIRLFRKRVEALESMPDNEDQHDLGDEGKNDSEDGTKADNVLKITEMCEEPVSGITRTSQTITNENKIEICNAAERDLMLDDVYVKGTESETIGEEHFADDGDQKVD